MTRTEYDSYLSAFNDCDFERLAEFFVEDAVFEHLPHLPQLRGRDAILDFYRHMKSKVRETVTPVELFMDEHGIAAEVATEFVALEDWPDFPATPLLRNEVYRMRGVVFYKTTGARFYHLRGVARLAATVTRIDGHTVDLLTNRQPGH